MPHNVKKFAVLDNRPDATEAFLLVVPSAGYEATVAHFERLPIRKRYVIAEPLRELSREKVRMQFQMTFGGADVPAMFVYATGLPRGREMSLCTACTFNGWDRLLWCKAPGKPDDDDGAPFRGNVERVRAAREGFLRRMDERWKGAVGPATRRVICFEAAVPIGWSSLADIAADLGSDKPLREGDDECSCDEVTCSSHTVASRLVTRLGYSANNIFVGSPEAKLLSNIAYCTPNTRNPKDVRGASCPCDFLYRIKEGVSAVMTHPDDIPFHGVYIDCFPGPVGSAAVGNFLRRLRDDGMIDTTHTVVQIGRL